MSEWFKIPLPSWANPAWVVPLALFIAGLVLGKIMHLYATWVVGKLLARYRLEADERAKKRYAFPVALIGPAIFWMVTLKLLSLSNPTMEFLAKGGRLLLTIGLVLAAFRGVNIIFLYLTKMAEQTKSKFDDILVPLMNKCASFLVLALGAIMIGDSLDLDMKGIIAGLGIGGLAVALAAKDTLSNLFGSLTLVWDRPFHLGDWIKIDNSVEGTVEKVGMRSCRIRTFYDSLITIPNGQIVNAHIDNYGARTFRRFSTILGLRYDTPPKKIEAFCEGVRHLIAGHKLTRKDYFHVYLNNLGDNAVEILLYVFWRVPDWSVELAERHRLLLDILRLGERLEVSFAFPTRTLELARDKGGQSGALSEEWNGMREGAKEAKVVVKNPLTGERARSSANVID